MPPALVPAALRKAATAFVVAMVAVAYVALWTGCDVGGGDEEEPLPPAVVPLQATGYLLAAAAEQSDDPRVDPKARYFVPGVEAWARNSSTGAETGHVETDLSGRFVVGPLEPGDYEVCWQARGFQSGCGHPFTVTDRHPYLRGLTIPLDRQPGTHTFFGRVRFADGSLARAFEPLANVNAFATVTAVDAGGSTVETAYVNNYGDYVLPGVSVPGATRLRAEIEAAAATIPLTSSLLNAPSVRVDLALPNSPPKIAGVNRAGSNRRWSADPAESITLQATASDADGDPIRYRWVFPDGTTGAGSTPPYTLPNYGAESSFTVVAYDGRGGYGIDSARISTLSVRFGGSVEATNGPVVAGAQVEVNGRTTTTNPNGYFDVVVDEADRYVLNIRKPGYGLVSQIYDRGITGGRWTVTRASVSSVDPTVEIDVTNRRQPSDCPGSLANQAQTGRDRNECGAGIRVVIPPNSLIDENGNPPAGNVDVELTTVDLGAPDSMPGDYTARDASGDIGYMESWGAGTVELRAGSTVYNLAPGRAAEIIIPIAPEQLAATSLPPGTIPLLIYDEDEGVWVEEGIATRVGNTYVAKTTHFSPFNVDLQFTNQACVRIESVIMPPKYRLELTVGPATPGGAEITKSTIIDQATSKHHLLYNMPPNRTLKLATFTEPGNQRINLIDPDPTNTSGPPGPEAEYVQGNTGPTQTPTSPQQPPFPYDACNGFGTGQPSQRLVELAAALEPPAKTNFLNGRFSFKAANLTELDAGNAAQQQLATAFRNAATDYYKTIDSFGLREDLLEFRQKNGFTGTIGPDEVEATYANTGDLGFGREMHCRRTAVAGLAGHDVACYVTNYGNRNTDDRQDLSDALARLGEIATVGMEYSRVELPASAGGSPNQFVTNASGNPIRFVKFYVYKKGVASTATPSPDPAGNGRAISADLDGFGERPVPQLCQVCHGGRYPGGSSTGAPTWNTNDPKSANLGSGFIPFDLTSFTLVDAAGTDHKNAAAQAAFRRLNVEMVLATRPSGADPVREAIEGMYGTSLSNTTQDEAFVVNGWSGEPDVYKDVIGPSCRSCHIMQGPSTPTWTTQAGFYEGGLVCSFHVMPHALMTHRRFWLSINPNQPDTLDTFLGGGTNCNTIP